MTERQVDRPLRLEIATQQSLDRLELRHQRAFVVQRAPPPHVSVGDAASESGMGPLGFGARLDRDHVHVRHEQERP